MRGRLSTILNSVRFFLALYPANPRCKTLHRTPNFAPSFISGLPDFKYAPRTLMLVPKNSPGRTIQTVRASQLQPR